MDGSRGAAWVVGAVLGTHLVIGAVAR